ncbi:MAG: glycosyltransferase family 39 protein [Ruminococcus sp.]|nr:glycosyltransferase family 39 protein [Ruminococcus sp.]
MKKSRKINFMKIENILFIALVTIIAMIARFSLFSIESGDYHRFLKGWYDQLVENNGFKAVGMDIGDYMPTYYYILAFLTYLPIKDLVGIKLVSCIADVVLALVVFKIVNHITGSRNKSIVAYATVLFLPSVILNSSAWGQCDSIFTLFILLSFYSILKGKDWHCIVYFSIAFVFKIQAIFFAPVILVLWLRGKVRLRTVLAFPIVYIVSILPALFTGGNFLDLITVYFRQSTQYNMLNMYIQNAWGLLFQAKSEQMAAAGIFFAGGVVLVALFLILRSNIELNDKNILTLSALFTLLVPFVLPHMHERYYYPATIFALIFIIINPKKIWTFLIMEFCLFQAEAHNLFGKDAMDFNFSVLMVTVVLVTYFKVVYDQLGLNISEEKKKRS